MSIEKVNTFSNTDDLVNIINKGDGLREIYPGDNTYYNEENAKEIQTNLFKITSVITEPHIASTLRKFRDHALNLNESVIYK